MAGFAQAGRQVHEAGRDDQAGGVDALLGLEVRRHTADREDAAVGDGDIGALVAARGRVDHAAVLDEEFHQASFPAMMLITAMRTAMPKVTCGRITLCRPSATEESISTPRFIGPGCITIASGLASASLSSVRP